MNKNPFGELPANIPAKPSRLCEAATSVAAQAGIPDNGTVWCDPATCPNSRRVFHRKSELAPDQYWKKFFEGACLHAQLQNQLPVNQGR